MAHELKTHQDPQNSGTEWSKEAEREKRTKATPRETWTGPAEAHPSGGSCGSASQNSGRIYVMKHKPMGLLRHV